MVVKKEKKTSASTGSRKEVCIQYLAEEFHLLTTAGEPYVCSRGINCKFDHVAPGSVSKKVALKNLDRVKNNDLRLAVQEAADRFRHFRP